MNLDLPKVKSLEFVTFRAGSSFQGEHCPSGGWSGPHPGLIAATMEAIFNDPEAFKLLGPTLGAGNFDGQALFHSHNSKIN
jgi:hypothetical protein